MRLFELTRSPFILLSLLVLCFLPALWVPFHLDDFTSIVQNPALLQQDLAAYLGMYSRRIVAYSSFWLEHKLWGMNPLPFHATNLLIHLLNAMVLFVLCRQLLTQQGYPLQHCLWLAFACSALWLVHPLNSQPVIYIVQRATLLATLFSLLAWLCWWQARTCQTGRVFWFAGAFVCLLAGVFSKEFALLIPLGWLLMDGLLLRQPAKRLVLTYLLPAVLLVLLILAYFSFSLPVAWQTLDSMTRETTAFSRLDYWLTQQYVLFLYLYKVVLPYPLLLEYPLQQVLSWPQAMPWLVLHGVVLAAAIAAYRLSPLIPFGVVLFYALHLIESGLIPIRDLAFEHRVYLPNAMLFLALTVLLYHLVYKYRPKVALLALCAVLPLCFALTLYRSWQWQDPLVLFEANLQHAPENYRLIHNIGLHHYQRHNYEQAEVLLLDAFYRARAAGDTYLEYADSALMGLIGVNKFEEAQVFVNEQIGFYQQQPYETSRLLTTYADAYIVTGWYPEAIDMLQQAQSLYPANPFIADKMTFILQQMANP